MPLPTVYFSIPAMDELDYLPQTLECIARQDYAGIIKVNVCVNQPQSDYCQEPPPERIAGNRALWRMLESNPWQLELHPIDRFTPERAWRDREGGVGAARQCCIDAFLPEADDSDLLISMDADTLFDADYVSQMVEHFEKHRKTNVVLPQYHHRLSGDDMLDRAMLRYEIYMRCYLFHLLRIGSPYAFTALGSAICCRIGAYRKSGGFDRRQAGEDFYLLQRLAKCGKISIHPESTVYPSPRLSDRVPFGTGPAIRLLQSGEGNYPIFPPEAFDEIAESYRHIDEFRQKNISTPLTDFMDMQAGNSLLWEKMRKNYPTPEAFARAFHQKADGLRIFQFLRHYAESHPDSDEENLRKTLAMPPFANEMPPLPADFSLATAPIPLLDTIRNKLKKGSCLAATPFDHFRR